MTANKIYRILGLSLIVASLIVGFYTRILTFDNFVNFGLDQIRDAEVYALMKLGEWPALGPIAPLNDNLGFHLFPLYHYLIGILTLGTQNLNYPLLINGIFSFLSIPLFIVLNYRLLTNTEKNKRLFLASLAGFWLSIFIKDIVNSNMAWNPTPMLFFVFLFFILVEKIHDINRKTSLIEHYLLWLLVGITTVFLSSLHTWSMLTFIPLFFLNCIYFVYIYSKQKKHYKIIFPIIAFCYILMLLTTYLISEINTDWQNTQSMISVVSNTSSQVPTSLTTILSRPFTNFMTMVEKSFILNPNLYFLALPFIVALIPMFAFNFKGNKFLLIQLLVSIAIYSVGISAYSGEIKARYQILIWYIPMIITISNLAYTPKSTFWKILQLGICIEFILLSINSNWIYTQNFLSRVYGSTKLIDFDEMNEILRSLPEDSAICYPWGVGYDYLPQLQFIDKYITQKNFRFDNNCKYSDYYIYLKNLPNVNSDYLTHKNLQNVKSSYITVLEGNSFSVYKIER